jgi:hypothetical protein
MESHVRVFRLIALAFLTAACILGAGSLGLLRPTPAYAQSCANGACTGIYCQYSPTHTCSFPDRNSCLTRRCAFLDH